MPSAHIDRQLHPVLVLRGLELEERAAGQLTPSEFGNPFELARSECEDRACTGGRRSSDADQRILEQFSEFPDSERPLDGR